MDNKLLLKNKNSFSLKLFRQIYSLDIDFDSLANIFEHNDFQVHENIDNQLLRLIRMVNTARENNINDYNNIKVSYSSSLKKEDDFTRDFLLLNKLDQFEAVEKVRTNIEKLSKFVREYNITRSFINNCIEKISSIELLRPTISYVLENGHSLVRRF